MRDGKIPVALNKAIYDFYEEMRGEGFKWQTCADLFNDRYDTDYAESSLRTRYQQYKLMIDNGQDVDYEKELLKMEQKQIKLELENKKLLRRKGVFNGILGELKDRELVKEIFMERWDEESDIDSHFSDKRVTHVRTKGVPTYAFGDVHLGFKYQGNGLANYDVPEAIKRVKNVMASIVADVKINKYKEILIVDLADQIEGSALRISQLARIAEDMSDQAKIYEDLIDACLEFLVEQLPDVKIHFHMISEDNHSDLRLFKTGRGDLTDNFSKLIANNVAKIVSLHQRYGGFQNVVFTHSPILVQETDTLPTVFAHGHQFSKKPSTMHENASTDVGRPIGTLVVGHWHNFSHTTLNYFNGAQQMVITAPSIVGDTDFAERLHLSNIPGFLKIERHGVFDSAKFLPVEFDRVG